MANTFAELKKNRKSSFEKLTQKVNQVANPSEKKGFGDDRFWSPAVDKAGNGYAVIRFLPASKNEDYPWVSYFDHGFQGPTGLWYIENSLTSLGKDDPVGQYNSKLWNSGIESQKEQARKQKRRLHYVSNIYVVSDAANPENEGKVFLFKYGKKIFQKINEVMNPQFEDEEAVNPFDFWEGANFKLKIRQVDGYRNYDKSEFDKVAPLSKNDEEMETIYNSLHSLKAFHADENFKSYAELETKLFKVLGLESPAEQRGVEAPTKSRRSVDEDYEEQDTKKSSSRSSLPEPPSYGQANDEDEDDLDTDYFKRLAED